MATVTDKRPDLIMLSLGAGVQSTTLALMAEADMFGVKPDVALFADTGWEPPNVYETVEAVAAAVSYPVETVSNGRNLADDTFNGVNEYGAYTSIPVYITLPGYGKSMGQRQCTAQYKIRPLERAAKARLGYGRSERVKPGTLVETWMGISTDEVTRAKPNRRRYIRNRYPLIEHNYSRQDCIRWLAEHHPDMPVGKSACVGCPYHDSETWKRIAKEHPEDFRRAVAIDHQLRTPGHNQRKGDAYLHRSRLPLDEAVALDIATPSLFDEECDGICGV